MRSRRLVAVVVLGALTIGGCGGVSSAIKAYATTAEEHATVMQLTFDNCMKAKNQAEKDAVCSAVRSSINAYKQSASELKTIKVSN